MSTSRPLFIYLQRPDDGAWVTAGKWRLEGPEGPGYFRYAPSYLDAGLPWAVDPVNLPLVDGWQAAHRYRGLHDVLRDACPDAWGRAVLQRTMGLPDGAHDSVYLTAAGNTDRWGALAAGASARPSPAVLGSPRLAQVDALVRELQAFAQGQPAVDTRLRKALVSVSSLGGARPKFTVRDGDDHWIVKPVLRTDTTDVPRLEHAALRWAEAAGMRVAESVHHQAGDLSVLRVRRFERHGDRRSMAVSGASLLSTEYPGGQRAAWSYPLLAQTLKRIGVPREDLGELFDRMVFNALVGNDDDHPRNHAALYDNEARQWRLSPAFDVVPNPDDEPATLAMQLSAGRFDISRASVLADAVHFGFADRREAEHRLDGLLDAVAASFSQGLGASLPPGMAGLLGRRLKRTRALLSVA